MGSGGADREAASRVRVAEAPARSQRGTYDRRGAGKYGLPEKYVFGEIVFRKFKKNMQMCVITGSI